MGIYDPAGPRASVAGERRVLVEFNQEELVRKWEEFFDEAGYEPRIIGAADRFPEERSLEVAFEDLNRFDTDMAIYLLRHPLNVLQAANEAVRRVAPATDLALDLHVRMTGLPRDARVAIRDLRAKHLGALVSVEGLVRKATEVRPQVTDASFECLRCGAVIKEPQEGTNFREPLECYEDQGGCKRSASSTKFKLLGESSRYVDTQKVEVQESPEGLRGGEEPQRISAFLEDDLTGKIAPGQRIVLNGVLRSSQRGRPGARSTLFDIFVDTNSVEFEQVEFEEIEVTESDIRAIEEQAKDPDIFRKIVASIAPSLYGLSTEKEALALQLFGGVPKLLPDGRRIRGDIHVLLVGDPGTGKSELLSYMSRLSPRGIYATGKAATAAGLCVAGESLVATGNGLRSIEEVVQPRFPRVTREKPVETMSASGEVLTFDQHHRAKSRPLDAVWRLTSPSMLLEIETQSGKRLRVTPATRLLVDHGMGQSWIPARFVRPGMRVATARALPFGGLDPPLTIDLLRGVVSRITVSVDAGFMETVVGALQAKFGTLREAAARMLVAEDGLYHRWRAGRHRIPLPILLVIAGTLAVPRASVARSIRDFSQAGGHRIRLPVTVNEDLAYFAGLVAGDGSVERIRGRGGFSIRFSNSNHALGAEYDALVRRLFGVTPRYTPQSARRAASRRFFSSLVATLLGQLGIPQSPKSSSVTIGDSILNGPRELLSSYLRGVFDTDGTIQSRTSGSSGVALTTTSNALAERAQAGLLRFGIHASVRVRRVAGRRAVGLDGRVVVSRRDQYVVEVRDWASLDRFRRFIGFKHPEKAAQLQALAPRGLHTNTDLVSSAGRHLRAIRRLLGIGYREAYGAHAGQARALESGEKATTHNTLTKLIDGLETVYRSGAWEGLRLTLRPEARGRVPGALRASGMGPARLARVLGITRDRAQEYFYRTRRPLMRVPVRLLERVSAILEEHRPEIAGGIMAEAGPVLRRISRAPARFDFIRGLSSADVRWDPVLEVHLVTTENGRTVYDLTVRDGHSFVANGILVHNTAAAVRDEFGEGRWTLEAGALVLADRGLAAIDELEKMNEQDRSAIHEALEQQRISVAKAGITAVLQARCSVLAAANPKFGRFDDNKYIAEQIELSPTLMSRFDVIFTLKDRPESERDRNLAEHIVRGHLVGEWLRRREEGKEVPEEEVELIEPYAPHLDPIFFRKYVAFAKRFSPVMTPDSMEEIKNKYLEIRKTGEGAGASVPITPRQLEAIIRLAEASARARLSPVVSTEDADRAVRITEYWMRKVAGEEGRFDIDIVQVGISQSQREQIIALRDIIQQLSGDAGSADYEDIVRIAGERGIAPARVDAWLKRWSQEGEVFSPAKDKYKLVERL